MVSIKFANRELMGDSYRGMRNGTEKNAEPYDQGGGAALAGVTRNPIAALGGIEALPPPDRERIKRLGIDLRLPMPPRYSGPKAFSSG